MKIYKVGVTEDQGGYLYIKAKNEAEAEEIAEEAMGWAGLCLSCLVFGDDRRLRADAGRDPRRCPRPCCQGDHALAGTACRPSHAFLRPSAEAGMTSGS